MSDKSNDSHLTDPEKTTRLKCAKCGRLSMRRIERRGFFQQKISPIFGFFPWECSNCRVVRLMKHRGAGRRRRRREQMSPSEVSQD